MPVVDLKKRWAEWTASFVMTETHYKDKGPCWLCPKIKILPNKSGGVCIDYPMCKGSATGEDRIHRRLYAEKFGSIAGWGLTRACSTDTCVNPDHFLRGLQQARTRPRL